MRILHALHGYPPEHMGGSELYVQRLAAVQAQNGHDVAVVAGTIAGGHDPIEAVREATGVQVHRIMQPHFFLNEDRWDCTASPWVEARFLDVVAAVEPDLVHVHHWIRLSRRLVHCAATRGVPCVVTAHDLFTTCPRIFRVRSDEAFCQRQLSIASCLGCVPREPWMRDETVSLQIELYARDVKREVHSSAALISPSREHARVLARYTGLPESRIDVVPHGTILDWPRPVEEEPWLPGAGRPLRIAHWGHLVHFKGPHVLLEALRELGRSDEYQLLLWGPCEHPDYAEELAGLQRELPVERVEFFDREDLRRLRADLAVFPSLAHESYSFVLDEAFALGLPVLASAVGALPERVGEGGAVFPAGDASALAAEIARLLDEPDRLSGMRAALPAAGDMASHWRALEPIYERACGSTTSLDDADDRADWERLAGLFERRARDASGEADSLRRDVEELAHHLGELRATRGSLEQDLRNHRARLPVLEQDLVNHKIQIAELTKDRDNYRDRIPGLEADIANRRLQEGELTKDLANHKARAAELEKDLANHKARAAEVEKDLANHKLRLQELEVERESHLEELAEARRQHHQLEDAVGAERASARELEERVRALKQHDAQLTQRAAELEQDVRRLRRENTLAMPLVVPVRLVLRLWDRMRKGRS